MVIDRNIRRAVRERVRNSTSVTLGEVVKMLDIKVEETDVSRLIEAEKKRAARRVIASVRDQNAVRTHLATCDQERTFIDVDRCFTYEKLALVEKQLKAKRNGINHSLGKVTGMKKLLKRASGLTDADVEETNMLAEKLYAMADELQALLAM